MFQFILKILLERPYLSVDFGSSKENPDDLCDACLQEAVIDLSKVPTLLFGRIEQSLSTFYIIHSLPYVRTKREDAILIHLFPRLLAAGPTVIGCTWLAVTEVAFGLDLYLQVPQDSILRNILQYFQSERSNEELLYHRFTFIGSSKTLIQVAQLK
jgi:hypothetical protein